MDSTETLPMSVTVSVNPADAQQLRRAAGVIALAESFTIDSPMMAEEATHELRNIAALKKSVVAMREGFVENAKKIIAHADATFKPTIDACDKANTILRASLLTYTTEQQRIADEERRAAAERERLARQKADAEAAAERAKAESKARELQQRADVADAARIAAEQAGDAKAAAAAAASAAKLAEKATAAIENGEAKAAHAQLVAAASVTVIEAPAKIEGFGSRENWIAEFVADEADAKAQIVAAIAAGRTDLLALLAVDTKSANKLAKALKRAFNVPGMGAVNRPISTLRAA